MGAALTADFQRVYGLRLAEVVEAYPAEETLALIRGLPRDSLYHGRLLGEESAQGFGDTQLLLYTIHNKLEALRTGYYQANFKGRAKFEPYESVPGADAYKRRSTRKKTQRMWDRLARSGGALTIEE